MIGSEGHDHESMPYIYNENRQNKRHILRGFNNEKNIQLGQEQDARKNLSCFEAMNLMQR